MYPFVRLVSCNQHQYSRYIRVIYSYSVTSAILPSPSHPFNFHGRPRHICAPRILMWILTPVYLLEHKPLSFFITLPLLASPSRSLLRTGLYATRYLPSVCRLEVLSLCVARLPTAEAVAGCCLHHIYNICYLTRLQLAVA